MKNKLLLFSVLAFVMLSFNGCTPDTVENTNETLITQDSIDQMLSQIQGTWYMYRKQEMDSWYNCDGIFSGGITGSFTSNLEFANFEYMFTSNVVAPTTQFNFSGNPHSSYFRLQVDGHSDYYALSKEGDNFYLYNYANNAGWNFSMGGKYLLNIYNDTFMVLVKNTYGVGSSSALCFKKMPVNEAPENVEGLNGTFQLTSQEVISSGVTTYLQNYTNGENLTFTNEIVAPDISAYSYIPGAYKGVWYRANILNNSPSAFLGPYLDYVYTLTNGDFYYSTSASLIGNTGNFLNVQNVEYEIIQNDGISLILRKGTGCYYTDWHFLKIN